MKKFITLLFQQYGDFKDFSIEYWKNYGGGKAFFSSPFVHFSLIVTIFSYPRVIDSKWWELPITVIPSVLGFSIASYAVIFSLSSQEFMKAIAGGGKEGSPSPYISINTTYLHFLVMQLAALLFSLLYGFLISQPPIVFIHENIFYLLMMFSLCGFFFFIYALTSALGAIKVIYVLASSFDQLADKQRRDEDENPHPKEEA